MTVELIHGDAVEVMAGMPECSVDAIVCDPPYDLVEPRSGGDGPGRGSGVLWTARSDEAKARRRGGFMGKSWDATGVAFRPETWAEALRVLKPGGFMLSMGGTRTEHRMTCAIEDAGFKIVDKMAHLHAQGFPKHKWQLKPAMELIVVAQKPCQGSAEKNVAKIGTGGLQIERYGKSDTQNTRPSTPNGNASAAPKGRYPSNVVFSHAPGCTPVGVRRVKAGVWGAKQNSQPGSGGVTMGDGWNGTPSRDPGIADPDGYETVEAYDCVEGCPVAELDRQSGERRSGRLASHHRRRTAKGWSGPFADDGDGPAARGEFGGDTGGASRFFFVAKASRRERDLGLEGMPAVERHAYAGNMDGLSDPRMNNLQNRLPSRNHHPTIKPIALMRHLVRLVCPPGGTVLDCFMGSGSTGCACVQEGFDFVGIDAEEEYVEIAEKRIAYWTPKQLALEIPD